MKELFITYLESENLEQIKEFYDNVVESVEWVEFMQRCSLVGLRQVILEGMELDEY